MSEAGLEALDDYVKGVLTEAEAERFEERLFAAACGGPAAQADERRQEASPDDVATFLALWDGVRHLSARGTFNLILTEAEAQRLLSSGIKIAYLDLDAPGPTHLSLSSEILLTRFGLDLTGVEQLDVEMMAGGQVVKTMHDVSFDAAHGAVYMACEKELALAGGRVGVVQRFVAVPRGVSRDEAAAPSTERRVLREFYPAPDAVILVD